MKDKQPIRENFIVDRPGVKEELDQIAEENKDDPLFFRLLKHGILLEVSALTFPGYKRGEKRPEAMVAFESDIRKNAERFAQTSEIETYCSKHGISFPSKERIEQLKRVTAKTFKVIQLAK